MAGVAAIAASARLSYLSPHFHKLLMHRPSYPSRKYCSRYPLAVLSIDAPHS